MKLLFFVAGIAVVILAAANGIAYKGIFQFKDTSGRVFAAVFGVALIVIGFVTDRFSGSGSRPSAKEYAIEITHPQPGDTAAKFDMRGKIARKLPPGYDLWVFRMYTNGRFWPVRKCTVYENDGEWEAVNCDLGVSSGKKDLAVYLVGTDGAALIQYVYASSSNLNAVRDQLSAQIDVDFIPPSPLVDTRTRDMIECKRVRVQRP